MDLHYYKLFNPQYSNLNNEELLYVFNKNKDKHVYSLNTFYTKYPDFNIIEYKNLNNELKDLNILDIFTHYHFNYENNKYIHSINDFYKKYDYFNLHEYKIFNPDLSLSEYEYLIHWCSNGINKNRICSVNYFKKINPEIDFNFIKLFYDEFNSINDIEIIKILLDKNIKDEFEIISYEKFKNIFPSFNCKIYKLFNNIEFINEIEIIKKWYKNDKDTDKIYSIESFYNNNNFDLIIYKFMYNLEDSKDEEEIIIHWYKNKNNENNIIDTQEKFKLFLDDFNYNLFPKKLINFKKFDKDSILNCYIHTLNNINSIYSDKLFYFKYPLFNIDQFKKFNNIKDSNNFQIINKYYSIYNKKDIIISIHDFYNKFPLFDINIYKNFNKNLSFKSDEEYIYYWYITGKNLNEICSVDSFYKIYNDFNLSIYKYFNNIGNTKNINELIIEFYNIFIKNRNIIYSLKSFYNNYPIFDKDIYLCLNDLNKYNDYELVIHWHSIGKNINLIYNDTQISSKSFSDLTINKLFKNFSLNIYKNLNKDLENFTLKDLIIHWYNIGKHENRIYSIETFYNIYPEYNFNIESDNYNFNNYSNATNYITEEDKIIYWMNIGIYEYYKKLNKNIIGRQTVNNINEVLIDLSNNLHKTELVPGISLIIRAKNEELNIKECIETVVDLVDEIIFVDNGSTDSTYDIMKEYEKKYNNIIKLYKYNIKVSKVGIEHTNAIKNNNKNTLGNFYNWCLSKSTKYNVFKWDADFICIRNNFIELVNFYNLKKRDDKFSIWFTGKTLFEDRNKYYMNNNSYYNEFRIFSYKNNFCWNDGTICEYTEPYLNKCPTEKKFKYIYPLFYELKRTSIDEFKERSSMIDIRDINDYNILNNIKENNILKLININNFINIDKKIILYTPSLSLGGGNQFILNMYNVLKIFGFKIIIVPLNKINTGKDKFNNIMKGDIFDMKNFTIDFISFYKPSFILFNSDIPFNSENLSVIKKITKIIFVTHSDVAYSNYFIEKYHKCMNKILTVNNYTIEKLENIDNIKKRKFFKIINYSNILIENTIISQEMPIKVYTKNKKFGIISRFSEDKNIPMLLNSLVKFFAIFPSYKCYLIGCDTENYDNYIKFLIKYFNLQTFVVFEGYQSNTLKYYEMFDFIILPSVSEGCSYNIIEAMNLRVPIIASNVGGNRELIKDKINGLLIEYNGIKKIEEKYIYINNYNEHLINIGYILNDENIKYNIDYAKNNFDIKDINVLIPSMCSCSLCKNNVKYNSMELCNICKYIKALDNLWKTNMNNITECIKEMVQNDIVNINYMINNNIDFINNHFNEDIYINQILTIFSE
jgi:glycosyltransferase involved in cell wall biosynthesis